MARRSGNDWYVGAMTDWTPRDLDIDFSFLPDGDFQMQSYEDGVNADRMGSDYKMTKTHGEQVDQAEGAAGARRRLGSTAHAVGSRAEPL